MHVCECVCAHGVCIIAADSMNRLAGGDKCSVNLSSNALLPFLCSFSPRCISKLKIIPPCHVRKPSAASCWGISFARRIKSRSNSVCKYFKRLLEPSSLRTRWVRSATQNNTRAARNAQFYVKVTFSPFILQCMLFNNVLKCKLHGGKQLEMNFSTAPINRDDPHKN